MAAWSTTSHRNHRGRLSGNNKVKLHFKRRIFAGLCILSLGFFLIPSKPAFSYEDEFWEKMAKRSDVKITTDNGIKTAHFSGGVTISDNGLSMDNSGKGAVRCSWEIYVTAKNMSELCATTNQGEFKEKIDYALNMMNAFIVRNSLSPITENEIQAQIKEKFLTLKKQTSQIPKEQFEKECSSGFVAHIAKEIASKSFEDLKKSIDDSLSIPRPPVMNPCL